MRNNPLCINKPSALLQVATRNLPICSPPDGIKTKLHRKQIYANVYMLLARYLWHEAPLQSRRKASTATTTQSRLLHFCNDPVCTFGNQVLGAMPVTTCHGALHKAQVSERLINMTPCTESFSWIVALVEVLVYFQASMQALTLIKGSCLPYKLVNIRSWSLRPPKTVLSGLASGFGASAGAALKARRSLQNHSSRSSEALAEQINPNRVRDSTC